MGFKLAFDVISFLYSCFITSYTQNYQGNFNVSLGVSTAPIITEINVSGIGSFSDASDFFL